MFSLVLLYQNGLKSVIDYRFGQIDSLSVFGIWKKNCLISGVGNQ